MWNLLRCLKKNKYNSLQEFYDDVKKSISVRRSYYKSLMIAFMEAPPAKLLCK